MSEKGIFPVTDQEAEMLHDLGWSSGYGWENELDWWKGEYRFTECAHEDDEVKAQFLNDLFLIRAAQKRAMEIVRGIVSINPGQSYHGKDGVTIAVFEKEEKDES